jgi:hypothetical protein
MELSTVFPMLRGRTKKQAVQIYDPDDNGTVLPPFQSLETLRDRNLDIIAENRLDVQTRVSGR